MTRRFFSGTSVQQAVMRAARHYAIDPDEVQFEELNKRHGFLRIRRKVVIEVDPENPKRSMTTAAAPPKKAEAPKVEPPRPPAPKPAAPKPVASKPEAPKPEAPKPEVPKPEVPKPEVPNHGVDKPESPTTAASRSRPEPMATPTPTADGHLVGLPERPRPVRERYPEASGTEALAAEKALKVALELLGMEAQADIRQGEGQLEIELTAKDQSRLLDDDGRVLAALQHLLPRLIRGFIGESIMCRLDCDNYQQIREEQLRDMAQRAADEVKRQGRAWSMKPMPPEERRVIHLTLEDDPTVKTDSVGDGFFKRVRVRPV